MPGACSRVSMTALEHIGVEYTDKAINLISGEQIKDEYQATNPRGKIPALVVNDQILTENAAILYWLHTEYPDAELFPKVDSNFEKAKQLSDLFWISAGWHPYVRANMMPVRWTTGDPEPVRQKGRELLAPLIKELNEHLEQNHWYYGEKWAITDVYLYWCYTTALQSGFDLSAYKNINRHLSQVNDIPAFQAAMAREKVSIDKNTELKASIKKIMAQAKS